MPVKRVAMLHLKTFGGLSVAVDGSPVTGAAVQRKTLALLALLATTKQGVSRDKLIAYLWPESDAAHGRNLLKQACYALRRDLHAPDLLLGATELRLNPAVISSDVRLFDEALERGDQAAAVALYGGPFLDGFFLSETEEFERWVESERTRLAKRVFRALEALAREASAAGRSQAGADHWRQLARIDPFSAGATIGLMRALDDAGERVEALQLGEAYQARVRKELGAEPAAEVIALTQQLRNQTPVTTPRASVVRGQSGSPPSSTPSRVRRATIAAVVMGVIVLGVVTVAIAAARSHATVPILAVGAIRDYTGSDAAGVAPTVAEMLATNLARLPRLHVLSTARIYELLGPARARGQESTAMERVAREARATQLVQGMLYRRPGGALRLELQRVDLQSGVVLQQYGVQGPDAFAVTDSATAALAASFGVSADTIRVADVTTRSLAAYRMYVAGLRAYYREEDPRGAVRLFEAALTEDSAFAMAAYYAGTINPILSGPKSHLAQAVRLAAHASDRERLLIRGAWAGETSDPAVLAIAETLAIRYPAEPDGHYLLGVARMGRGDFLGSVAAFRVVAAMDSLGLRGVTVRCRGCEAMANIVTAYGMADSLVAAERAARELLVLQPRSSGAWLALAVTLEHAGRFDEARAAYDSVLRLSPGAPDEILLRVPLAVRRGDFAEAEGLVGPRQRYPTPGRQWGAWWWGSTSLRYQGRLREALAFAPQMRAMQHNAEPLTPGPPYDASLIEAEVLLEMGRAREAAALFDSLAAFYIGDYHADSLPSRYARHLCWTLTHRATALAAAGDTVLLQRLADSLEILGQQSSYGRDRLLHHHIRGLLLLARGRAAEAATEFRQAVFSLTYGYTRTNLELARALLALGRPRDAVAVLQPAFRGPLDASNLYVTHTELHEMLARAFDAAGERDSAMTHYRWVVAAWRNADPEFRPRRELAQRRLSALDARLAISHATP